MDLGGLVVRWAGLGYAVAHPDHPLSTPLVQIWVPCALKSTCRCRCLAETFRIMSPFSIIERTMVCYLPCFVPLYSYHFLN